MTADEPHASVLNANQRRHYEVLLAGLENALAELGTALSKPEGESHAHALTTVREDLPAGLADAVAPRLARARALIHAAAAGWGLTARETSRRRTLKAALTAQLIRLEEGSVDHLRGYGDIHPDAAGEVDPVLSELHAIVADLLTLLRK
jgi:hypothetical protein